MRRATVIRTQFTAAVVVAAAVAMTSSIASAQAPSASSAPKPATTAAAPAAAKPGIGDAKKSFQAGETKFKAGDFAGALTEFQAADAVKGAPQTARYIAVCQDKLGNYADAAASYDRFLADVPSKMAKEGDEAKARVAEIKAMPGKLHVETTPAGATVTLDGKPAATPTPTDIDAPAGHHTLHFTAEGRIPQDKELDVAFASKQDVRADLEAVPPPAAAPVAAPVAATPPPPAASSAPPAEPRSKVPAYITGGLAVVAAGVGTVFGVIALGDKSDFDKNPTTSKADDGENHALIADMAFGVALTLGVTSAVLFLTRDETSAPPAAASSGHPRTAKAKPITITPSPIVTPHGGGAGALLRF